MKHLYTDCVYESNPQIYTYVATLFLLSVGSICIARLKCSSLIWKKRI